VKQNSIKKIETSERFNYRLSLFTYSSFTWIYESFYGTEGSFSNYANGNNIESNKKSTSVESFTVQKIKRVPIWIEEYLTALGLANWIMPDGSRQKGQGICIATNSFSF